MTRQFTGISGHHVRATAECTDTVSATFYNVMGARSHAVFQWREQQKM